MSTSTHFYNAFGLNIASDIDLPELASSNSTNTADVLIEQGEITPPESERRVIGDPTQLFLKLPGVAQFHVQAGKKIIYSPENNVEKNSLILFLLGSCMGALLQQRGCIVLHGNALTIDEKSCTLFVGHTGAGKSTTAAWYLQKGAKMLADDVCAITFDQQNRPIVLPSYPQVKLWQDSADLLNINTNKLPQVRAKDKKFKLNTRQQFQYTPIPLQHIIEIQKDKSTPYFQTLTHGLEKIKLLTAHFYRPLFLRRMNIQEEHAKKLLTLISKGVNISSVTRPYLTKHNYLYGTEMTKKENIIGECPL